MKMHKGAAESMPSGSTSVEVMLVLSKMWEDLSARQQGQYFRTFARQQSGRLLTQAAAASDSGVWHKVYCRDS